MLSPKQVKNLAAGSAANDKVAIASLDLKAAKDTTRKRTWGKGSEHTADKEAQRLKMRVQVRNPNGPLHTGRGGDGNQVARGGNHQGPANVTFFGLPPFGSSEKIPPPSFQTNPPPAVLSALQPDVRARLRPKHLNLLN